jgi:hypothetical protein
MFLNIHLYSFLNKQQNNLLHNLLSMFQHIHLYIQKHNLLSNFLNILLSNILNILLNNYYNQNNQNSPYNHHYRILNSFHYTHHKLLDSFHHSFLNILYNPNIHRNIRPYNLLDKLLYNLHNHRKLHQLLHHNN